MINSKSEINKAFKIHVSDVIERFNQATLKGVGIKFENQQNFDPFSFSMFVDLSMFHSRNERMGKTFKDSQEDEGFFQISIYVENGSFDYDNGVLELVDFISENFNQALGENVHISNVRCNQGRYSSPSDAASDWYIRDMTIEWMVLS